MAVEFHIQQPPVLNFAITRPQTVEFEIRGRSSGGGGGVPYVGPYTVIPQVDNAVVLQTATKTMTDNVTVTKIPQYEVSNPAGGKTLTIGEITL